MPLDNHPPARLLAQMRAFTKTLGLPDGVGDQMAARDFTMQAAEAAKPGLQHIVAAAEPAGLSISEIEGAALSLLDKMNPDEGEAQAPKAAARDAVFAQMAKRTEGAPARHSPTPASYGGTASDALTAVMGGRRVSDLDPYGRIRMAAVDGMLARLDRSHEPSLGRDFASMSLAQMRSEIDRANPRSDPFSSAGMSAVMAGQHTTSDFPIIVGDTLGKYVARRFERARVAILEASHETPALDYRQSFSVDVSSSPALEVVGEGGEIKYTTMDENGELMPVPEDLAGIFAVSNKLIQNDNVGLLTQAGNRMVEGARDTQRRILVTQITANGNLRDGNPVFHTSRGNIAAGGAAPTVETLSEARQAMRKQVDTKGVLLSFEPWAIVCGADLETTCQKLLADLDATKVDDQNPFAGKLRLIVEPTLPDTEWYLIADPARYDGLAHCYLDGMSAPRVEMRPGWNTLGAEYRLVWAFDAKFIQPLSWFKNPGA